MAASKQTEIHTHVCNAVPLVWGLLTLAPINSIYGVWTPSPRKFCVTLILCSYHKDMQILISRTSYHIKDKGGITKYKQHSRKRTIPGTIVVQSTQKVKVQNSVGDPFTPLFTKIKINIDVIHMVPDVSSILHSMKRQLFKSATSSGQQVWYGNKMKF